jgi:hypothetical protein
VSGVKGENGCNECAVEVLRDEIMNRYTRYTLTLTHRLPALTSFGDFVTPIKRWVDSIYVCSIC